MRSIALLLPLLCAAGIVQAAASAAADWAVALEARGSARNDGHAAAAALPDCVQPANGLLTDSVRSLPLVTLY